MYLNLEIMVTRRCNRVWWHHYGRHPMMWFAGPMALRFGPWEAAKKPWNRNRRPVRRSLQ